MSDASWRPSFTRAIKRCPVTVCIGALCRWGDMPVVVAASDRMITAGDIQFQPPRTKIYQLTTSIFALTAGDASACSEILDHARADILARLSTDQSWLPVEAAADFVSRSVIRYRKKLAERMLLVPLGLTIETFMSRQREMSDRWAERMTEKLFGYESGVSLIVAGVDTTGAHLWLVDGFGKTACNDSVGFAAIGFGQWHAESQFMFAGHAPWRPLPETLLLTFAAKKRAEVAPGVGAETDMCTVAGLGNFFQTDLEMMGYLRSLYSQMRETEDKAAIEVNKDIGKHFDDIVKSAQEAAKQSQQQPDTSVEKLPPQDSAETPSTGGDDEAPPA